MDQLRVALDWLKRYHFWVLSVLVALIAVACWAKASSKMVTTFKANESTIQGQFKSVKDITSDSFHPNDDINAKQAAQTKKQAEGVAELWKQLYERQRETALKWPAQLTKEFADTVEKLPFGANIPEHLRNNYRDYVDRHFPELPKIVDAQVMEANETNSPGGYGRGSEGPGVSTNGQPDESDYICDWQDQNVVRELLYFRDRPSSTKIWVTQEDLWVYETLLKVIAKTNQAAGATRKSNAAVSTIKEIGVGKGAGKSSRTTGRLAVPPPTQQASGPGPGGGPEGQAPGGAPPSGPGPGGPGGPESYGPGGPGATGGQGMTEDQERSYLLSWRYLDAQGKPIQYAGGGTPADGSSASAAAPDLSVFGLEYKRLPVRMVLTMDQRWLPRLISECASQPLQIEVQEVRINVSEANGAGGGPGGSGGFEGAPGGGAGPKAPDHSGVQTFPQHPEIVNVIIQGTIYIFNKPNQTVLQTDQPLAVTGGGQ